MADYLDPVNGWTRKLATVACVPAALLFGAMAAFTTYDMIRRGDPMHNGKPPWLGALVCWVLAVVCGWMAVRLWSGRPANGVTVLPVWFIELFGVLALAGIVWVQVRQGVVREELTLGGALIFSMICVRRAVRRRAG